MGALTTTAAQQSLNWLIGTNATAPVLPLRVRLMTANGSDTTPGTECSGDTYAPQDAAFTATNPATNSAVIAYGVLDTIDSQVLVGFEVWDSATTPVRWWHAPFASITIPPGERCEFDVGALTLSQD